MGLIVSVVGSWMQRTAQGWLVYELTGRAIYLGLVAACGTLPMLLLSLPAGVLADRVRKRNILLVTQSLAMLQAFVLAFLIYTDAVRVWHVMVLASTLGAIWAFDMPTRHAMVLELVDRDDALNAVSLNSTAFNTGRVLGPALAGVLVATLGMAVCFFINGVTFLALISALALIAARPPGSASRASFSRQIADGVTWARRNPVPLALLSLLTVVGLFALSHPVLLPVFAGDIFHVGPTGYGLMMSAYGVGALVAALFLTIAGGGWPAGLLATAGSFIYPVAMLGVAAAPGYAAALAALFCMGVGLMSFNVLANTMLQKHSPDELRGRIMSFRSFLFAGMSWIGDVQMGVLGEWLGARIAYGISAAVCLCAAAAVWSRVPQLRRSD